VGRDVREIIFPQRAQKKKRIWRKAGKLLGRGAKVPEDYFKPLANGKRAFVRTRKRKGRGGTERRGREEDRWVDPVLTEEKLGWSSVGGGEVSKKKKKGGSVWMRCFYGDRG